MKSRGLSPSDGAAKLVRIAGLEPANWVVSSLLIIAFLYTSLLWSILHCPNECKHYSAFMCGHEQKNVWGCLGTKTVFGKCLEIGKRPNCLGDVWGAVAGTNARTMQGSGHPRKHRQMPRSASQSRKGWLCARSVLECATARLALAAPMTGMKRRPGNLSAVPWTALPIPASPADTSRGRVEARHAATRQPPTMEFLFGREGTMSGDTSPFGARGSRCRLP